MNKKEILKDYVKLNEQMAIYEYIADNTDEYWYDCAKNDEYDKFLLKLADEYDIQLNFEDFEDTEEIYETEEKLLNKLLKLLID